MSLLVVGSVALDTVETPYGSIEEELGGSAVYFSLAASQFSRVRLVGVVGRDFPQAHLDRLASLHIDLAGLQHVEGETFRWHGAYEGRMEQARTVEVRLNVFDRFIPAIPADYADSRYVFLANGSPTTHMHVLEQVDRPKFVLADTMDFYIQNERDALLQLMQRIDGLILNDMEALQLSGEAHLLGAARWICQHGPSWCIVKKGEHGSLLRAPQGFFVLPGFPHESVVDPTGAGDAFAGGLMGYVASKDAVDLVALEFGLVYGTITASFAIGRLGPAGLEGLTHEAMQGRLDEFLTSCRLLRS
jgi:sugar/nucleoside kinase (ribokinase family)